MPAPAVIESLIFLIFLCNKSGAQGRGRFAIGGLRETEMQVAALRLRLRYPSLEPEGISVCQEKGHQVFSRWPMFGLATTIVAACYYPQEASCLEKSCRKEDLWFPASSSWGSAPEAEPESLGLFPGSACCLV
jgi:hypothetical protein